MNRRYLKCFSLALLFSLHLWAEGGMYPINTIGSLNLKKEGLKMDVKDIYNPSGKGLIKAVVQLGGCTGSFVSDKGLIITNHHCAFGGLEPYSTPGNNLLEKGYVAGSQEKELPIKGLTCKILISNTDVSTDILKGTESVSDGVLKKNIIAKNIASYKAAEVLKNPDYTIEIAEMLPGKSYMLFRYITIKDIRIVYIPARNIGEFGGESDNWEWPRHTGDFSFVRAYVGKDGKSADYSQDNVPFHPEEFLNINAKGLAENDFVFIVGYPGRTFRNLPADFIKMQEEFTLPYISDLYTWEINTIKSLGAGDAKFMIKNEPKIKQLANVEKNYKGKLKTMRSIALYKSRLEEEQKIANKLNIEQSARFKNNLNKSNALYASMGSIAFKSYWYNNLYSESKAIALADNIRTISNAFRTMKTEEYNKIKKNTLSLIRSQYKSIYVSYDSIFLKKMLLDASNFSGSNMVPGLNTLLFKNENKMQVIREYIAKAYKKNLIFDSTSIFKIINDKPEKIEKLKDPFMDLVKNLNKDYHETDSLMTYYKAQLDALLPEYVDLRMEALGGDFLPDANRTLRLTYGYIRGYHPSDATYCTPFTTVRGMAEKDGAAPDYRLNEDIARLLNQNAFGAYKLKDKNDLPMCLLYNTDTTGGNSGSPLLDGNGQLIGINFDRCLEATVNDYAWNESYSRSIAVDIRFVLWTTSMVSGADYLLKEMYITQ